MALTDIRKAVELIKHIPCANIWRVERLFWHILSEGNKRRASTETLKDSYPFRLMNR